MHLDRSDSSRQWVVIFISTAALTLAILVGGVIALPAPDMKHYTIRIVLGVLLGSSIVGVFLLATKPYQKLALMPLVVFFADIELSVGLAGLSVADIVMWLTLASYFLWTTMKKGKLHLNRPESFLLLLAIYRLISILFVPEKISAAVTGFSFLLNILFVVAAVRIFLHQPLNYLTRLSVWLIALSIPIGLLGIAQHVLNDPIVDLSHFQRYKYVGLLVEGRAQSLFGNPNTFAIYMSIVLLLALALFKQRNLFWLRLVFILAISVSLVSVLLTLSRGAYISLLFGIIALFWQKNARLRQWRLLLLAVLLFFLLYQAYDSLVVVDRRRDLISTILRGDEIRDQSALNRLYFITTASNVLRVSPLFGSGTSQYVDFFAIYRDPRILTDRVVFPSHSIYLTFLVENGVVGFTLFIVPIAFILKQLFELSSAEVTNKAGRTLRQLISGYRAALITILVYGASHNIINSPLFYFVLASAIALTIFGTVNVPKNKMLSTVSTSEFPNCAYRSNSFSKEV